jgi:hypothetical protein
MSSSWWPIFANLAYTAALLAPTAGMVLKIARGTQHSGQIWSLRVGHLASQGRCAWNEGTID